MTGADFAELIRRSAAAAAKRSAAQRFAPAEIPAGNPRSAKALAAETASSSVTVTISSSRETSSTPGMKLAPMP